MIINYIQSPFGSVSLYRAKHIAIVLAASNVKYSPVVFLLKKLSCPEEEKSCGITLELSIQKILKVWGKREEIFISAYQTQQYIRR
jgi:hypothetical protein